MPSRPEPVRDESLDVPELQLRLTARMSLRLRALQALNLISTEVSPFAREVLDREIQARCEKNGLTALELDEIIARAGSLDPAKINDAARTIWLPKRYDARGRNRDEST